DNIFANVCPAGPLGIIPCDVACKPAHSAADCVLVPFKDISPVIGAFGSAFTGVDTPQGCPPHDQRLFLRPEAPLPQNCTIGAYESLGVKDPDGDGIPSQMDPLPDAFSDAFSDDLFFGRTSGRIVNRAGQTVFLLDAPSLEDGVEIAVAAST